MDRKSSMHSAALSAPGLRTKAIKAVMPVPSVTSGDGEAPAAPASCSAEPSIAARIKTGTSTDGTREGGWLPNMPNIAAQLDPSQGGASGVSTGPRWRAPAGDTGWLRQRPRVALPATLLRSRVCAHRRAAGMRDNWNCQVVSSLRLARASVGPRVLQSDDARLRGAPPLSARRLAARECSSGPTCGRSSRSTTRGWKTSGCEVSGKLSMPQAAWGSGYRRPSQRVPSGRFPAQRRVHGVGAVDNGRGAGHAGRVAGRRAE